MNNEKMIKMKNQTCGREDTGKKNEKGRDKLRRE